MKLSVFLLSHNKNGYVQEAVQSILDQDYEDYELYIIENSTDTRTRNALWNYLTRKKSAPDQRIEWIEEDVPLDIRMEKYVPSWLLNKYYPEADSESVILFLADDDLFVPGLFSAVAEAFTEHSDWAALYYHLARTNASAPGQGMHWEDRFTGIPAIDPRWDGMVDCQIDACQIAYRRHVLNDIGQPYFDEGMAEARHCDGVHLQKIAEQYTFYPINTCGVIHRHTPISTWN